MLCAPVFVVKADDVVFVKVTLGYFKKHEAMRAADNPVLGAAFYKKILAGSHRNAFFAYNHRAIALDDMPCFVAVLVLLQAEFLAGLYGDYLDRRLLVECKALKIAPRALFFLVLRKAFHTP